MNRKSHWSSALALPLALWSAVPGIQWCPLGWAEVSPECFVACISPVTILNVGTEGCCERSCAVASSGASCGVDQGTPCPAETGPSCDPVASPASAGREDRYPGGRAFCLAGPSGGDGLPPATQAAPDASGPAAVLLPDNQVAAVAGHASRPVAAALTHPRPSPIGAIPRGRAPPRIGRTTC